MSDLKPCPFCGNQARLVRRNGITLVWCKKCETGTGLCVGDGAITKWNTRPAEDAKDAEIARLKSIIEELTKPRTDKMKEAVQTARKEVFIGKDTNAPDTNVGTKGEINQ